MARTVETEMTFKHDLQAVDDLNAGFWTPEYIKQMRTSTLERHAAYDARFQRMIDEVRAIEPHSKRWARDLLERLGNTGCLSGTLEFQQTTDALGRMGVTGANHVFEHDRRYIAAAHLPAKTPRAIGELISPIVERVVRGQKPDTEPEERQGALV